MVGPTGAGKSTFANSLIYGSKAILKDEESNNLTVAEGHDSKKFEIGDD